MKIKMLPILLNIVSKIDLNPVIKRIREIKVSGDLTDEKKTELGMEILGCLIPQLGKISEDIIPLVAAIKNVSEEEAAELDVMEIFKEISKNKAIQDFFTYALSKKIEQKS